MSSFGIFLTFFCWERFYSELLIISLIGGVVVAFFFIATIVERLLLIIYNFFYSTDKVTETVMSIPQLLELFKPKILLASTSIWIGIYALQQLWNIDFSIDYLERAFLILLFIGIFSFSFSKFYSYIKTENASVNFYRLLFRTCSLIFLSFIYSVWIGIGATTTVVKNNFVKEGYYKDYFSELASDTASFKVDTTIIKYTVNDTITPDSILSVERIQVTKDTFLTMQLEERVDILSLEKIKKLLNCSY